MEGARHVHRAHVTACSALAAVSAGLGPSKHSFGWNLGCGSTLQSSSADSHSEVKLLSLLVVCPLNLRFPDRAPCRVEDSISLTKLRALSPDGVRAGHSLSAGSGRQRAAKRIVQPTSLLALDDLIVL